MIGHNRTWSGFSIKSVVGIDLGTGVARHNLRRRRESKMIPDVALNFLFLKWLAPTGQL